MKKIFYIILLLQLFLIGCSTKNYDNNSNNSPSIENDVFDNETKKEETPEDENELKDEVTKIPNTSTEKDNSSAGENTSTDQKTEASDESINNEESSTGDNTSANPEDTNNNSSADQENKNDDKLEDEECKRIKAVWWWNDSLTDEYLNFAHENGINTIYYCSSLFNETTNTFIKKANEYNMDVYFLTGDYSWIENRTGLYNVINKFEEYQLNYDNKFKGIHFDIEPHQHPDFSIRRTELIGYLIDIAYDLSFKEYNIEYDIPFWLNDNITRNNIEKKAYQWMIDYADNVVIMSYRDSKEAILDVASDEYNYAKAINKSIIVSVETYSLEGDFVSFYEEGKEYMMSIVNDIYADNILGVNGIAIHHIQKWYEMD